jgi:hypothetical protein
VKVARRFPVRVRLESPPERFQRIGASAMVVFSPGSGEARGGADPRPEKDAGPQTDGEAEVAGRPRKQGRADR